MIFILIFLSGCHTYFFQPVEKQIIGTWIKSPQAYGVVEEWTFDEDNTLRIREYTYGVLTDDKKDHAGDREYIEWKIQNKITKHHLYTDNYLPFTINADVQPKWLIIKVNKSELYLSSIEGKTRGAWQWGFVKK